MIRALKEILQSFKWAAIGIWSNFTGQNPKPLQPTEISELVVRFAKLISERQYVDAYELTTDSFKQLMSLKELEAKVNNLLPKQFGRARKFNIWNEETAEGASFLPGDIAWVYVVLEGKYAEAIAATVAAEGNRKLIREITWGRP